MDIGLGKVKRTVLLLGHILQKGVPRRLSLYLSFIYHIVAPWIVVFFIMTFNLCGHHSVNWDVQPGHSALCQLTYPYFEGSAISDFLLDVFFLTLPFPKVRQNFIWQMETTPGLTLSR